MRYRPISLTHAWFSDLIRGILKNGWPAGVELASSRSSVRLAGDPRLRIDADPRLAVMLSGRHRHAITQNGSRVECRMARGDCLYWPGHAWNISIWNTPCVFFGIVFRRTFTRFLVADFPGGPPPPGATPHAIHTARPIGGAALQLVRGLDILAEQETSAAGPARPMLIALLQLADAHLREEEKLDAGEGANAWQRVLDHVNRNYPDRMLSRDSVAAAIGLHPNYLSALAAKNGGGFHRMLEDIRTSHARHLLMNSALKTQEIAALCGYAGTTSFIRAFHRVMGEYPQHFRKQRRVV